MTPFRTFLNQFRREEGGSVVVEAMLILPILIWCFMAMFVFFDAYRTQGANVKAAYVLGDIISRETEYISPSYMNSLFALQGFLVDTGTNQQLRVTVAEFTGPNHNNGFDVVWSQARGGAVAMTSANLDSQFDDYIPVMSIGDTVIKMRPGTRTSNSVNSLSRVRVSAVSAGIPWTTGPQRRRPADHRGGVTSYPGSSGSSSTISSGNPGARICNPVARSSRSMIRSDWVCPPHSAIA
jgi:hypothetical protein